MKKFLIFLTIFTIFTSIFLFGCGKKVSKASIELTIYDSNNNPIENVTVEVDGNIKMSDKNGKATFLDLDEGSYTINIQKEGFEEVTEEVNLSKGEKRELNIVLKEKSVEFVELKKYDEIRDFKIVAEYRSSKITGGQKVEIIKENYGKREYMKITDLNTGEVLGEAYLDEEKAKIKSGENWLEMPREQVGSITESFTSFIDDFTSNVYETYNLAMSFKEGSLKYKTEKLGEEIINGYPSLGFKIYFKFEGEKETQEVTYTVWVIKSGEFKNYPTRLIGKIVTNEGEINYLMDITEFNEAKVPNI